MKRRYTEVQRKSLLDEWRKTGESLGAVAKRRGIELRTAYQWSRRAGEGRAKGDPRCKVSFAQIVRTRGGSTDPMMAGVTRKVLALLCAAIVTL
ncbi:transposase, partial [Myxococcota bacterium]